MTAPDPTPAVPLLTEDLMIGRCVACGTPRKVTARTQGVWTTCDDCGATWWCVVADRDYLDEPTAFRCSGGCDDGWGCDCGTGEEWGEDEAGAQP